MPSPSSMQLLESSPSSSSVASSSNHPSHRNRLLDEHDTALPAVPPAVRWLLLQVAAGGVYPPPLPPPAPPECTVTPSVDPPTPGCDVDSSNRINRQQSSEAASSSATWLQQLLQQHHQGSPSQRVGDEVEEDVTSSSSSNNKNSSLNSKQQHKHSSIAVDSGCAKHFDSLSNSSKSVNRSSNSGLVTTSSVSINSAGSRAASPVDSAGRDSGDPPGELKSVSSSLPAQSSFDCAGLPVNFAELVELASLITCKVGESVLPVAVTVPDASNGLHHEPTSDSNHDCVSADGQKHSSCDSVETNTEDTAVVATPATSSSGVSEESAGQDTFSQLLFQTFNNNLETHLSGGLVDSGTSDCSRWENSTDNSISTNCKPVLPSHLDNDSGIGSNSSNSVSSSKSLYIDFSSSSNSSSGTVTTYPKEHSSSSAHESVSNIISSHHHGNATGKLVNSTSSNPNSVVIKDNRIENTFNSGVAKETADSFRSTNSVVETGSSFYPFPYLTPKYSSRSSGSSQRPFGFINHTDLEGYPIVDSLATGSYHTQTIVPPRPELPLPPPHWGNYYIPKNVLGGNNKGHVNQYLESGATSFGGRLQYQDPLAHFYNSGNKSSDHFCGEVEGISLTNRLVRQLKQVQQALEERSAFNNQGGDPGASSLNQPSYHTSEGYPHPARYFPLHPPTVAAAFRNILTAAASSSGEPLDNRQRQPVSTNSSASTSFDESEPSQRSNSSQYNHHLRFERKGPSRLPETFEGNSSNSSGGKKCGWYRKPATGDQLSSSSQPKSQGLHHSSRGNKLSRRRGSPPTRAQHSFNNNTAGSVTFAASEESSNSATVYQPQQHSSRFDQPSVGWTSDSSANQFAGPLLQPYYAQQHRSNNHYKHLPLDQAPPLPPAYYKSDGRFVHQQQFPFLSSVDSQLVSEAASSSQLASSNLPPHSLAPGLPLVTLGAPSYRLPATGYPQHQLPPPSLVASLGPPSCSCLYCCVGGTGLDPIVGAYLPHPPLNAMVRSTDRHAKYGAGQPPPSQQQNLLVSSDGGDNHLKNKGAGTTSSLAASMLKKTPSTATSVSGSTTDVSKGEGARNDSSNAKASDVDSVESKQTGNSRESSVIKTSTEQSPPPLSSSTQVKQQLKSGSNGSDQLSVSQNVNSGSNGLLVQPNTPSVAPSKRSKKRKKNANKKNKGSPADSLSGDGAGDTKCGLPSADGGRTSASNCPTERQNNRRNKKANGVAVADSNSILNCLFGGGAGDSNRQSITKQQHQQQQSWNRHGRGADSASSTPPPPPPPTPCFNAAPPYLTNIGKRREQHDQQQFVSLPLPPPHSRYQQHSNQQHSNQQHNNQQHNNRQHNNQQHHNQQISSEPRPNQQPMYYHQHYPPPSNNQQQHYQQLLQAPPGSCVSFPPVSATGPSIGQCVPSSHQSNGSPFVEAPSTDSTLLLQHLSSTFGHQGVAVSFATSTFTPPPSNSQSSSSGANGGEETDTANQHAAEGKSGIMGTAKELDPVKVFLEEALLSSSSGTAANTHHSCHQQTRGSAENSKRSYAAAASNSLNLYQPPPNLPPLIPGHYTSLPQFPPPSQYPQHHASGHPVHATTATPSFTSLSTTNEATVRHQLPPLFSQPPPLPNQLVGASSGYYTNVRTPLLPPQLYYHPHGNRPPMGVPSTTSTISSSCTTADRLRMIISSNGPLLALPTGSTITTTTTATTCSSSSPSQGVYASNLVPGCGRIALGNSEGERCSDVTGTEDAANAVFIPTNTDGDKGSAVVKTCACCTGKCSENDNASSQKNSINSAPTATLKLRFGSFSPTDDSLLPSPDGIPSVTFTNLTLPTRRGSHSVVSTANNSVTSSTIISANSSPVNYSHVGGSVDENLPIAAAASYISRGLLSLENFPGTANTTAGGRVSIGYPRNTTSNPIERDVESMMSSSYSAALPAMREAFTAEARWEQVERSLVAVVEAEHFLKGQRQPPSASQSVSTTVSTPSNASQASLSLPGSAGSPVQQPPGTAGAAQKINLPGDATARSRGRRGRNNNSNNDDKDSKNVAAGVHDGNNRNAAVIPVADEIADNNPNEEEVVVVPARCSCNLPTCATCTGEDTGYSSRCSTPPAAGGGVVPAAATPGNNNRRIPANVNGAGNNNTDKRLLSTSALGLVASSGASSIGDEEDCSDHSSPDGDDTSDGEVGRGGREAARRGRHQNKDTNRVHQQQQWRRFKEISASGLASPSASLDYEGADSDTRSSHSLPVADDDATSNKKVSAAAQTSPPQQDDDDELQNVNYSPLSGGLGYPGYETSSVEDNADTASVTSVSSARGAGPGEGGKGGDGGYRRHNAHQQQHLGHHGGHRGGYHNHGGYDGVDNYYAGEEEDGEGFYYYQQRGNYNRGGGNRKNGHGYNNFNNFRNHYYSNNNNNGGNRGARGRGKGNTNNGNGYYNNGHHGYKTNNGDFPNNYHFNDSYNDGSNVEPSNFAPSHPNHRSNNNNYNNNTRRSRSNSNSFSTNNSVNGSTTSLHEGALLQPSGQQRPASATLSEEDRQEMMRFADGQRSVSVASIAAKQGTDKLVDASSEGSIDKASVEAAGTKVLSEFVQGANSGMEKNAKEGPAPAESVDSEATSLAASDAAIISTVTERRFVQQQQSQQRRFSMDAKVLDEQRRSSVVSLPPLPSESKGLLIDPIDLLVRKLPALSSRGESNNNAKSTSQNVVGEATCDAVTSSTADDNDVHISNNKLDNNVAPAISNVARGGYSKDNGVEDSSSISLPLPPPHPVGRNGPQPPLGFRFPPPAMGGPPVPPHTGIYPQHHPGGGPKPWHFAGGVNGGGRFPLRPPFGGRGGYNHNNNYYHHYHQNSPVHYGNNHGGGGAGGPAALRFHSGNQYYNGNPNRRYHNGGAGGVAPGVAQNHGRNGAYYENQRGRNHNNHKYNNNKHHLHEEELDVYSASDCESDVETAGTDLSTLKEIKTSAGTFDLMASRAWTKTPSPAEIEQHVMDYHIQVRDTPKQLLGDPHHDRLSQQIWDLFYDKHQKDETLRKKHELRTRIYNALQDDESIHRLLLVGSSVTGFGVDESDVDLCLRPKGRAPTGRSTKGNDHSHHPHSNGEEIAHLTAAHDKLRHCPWIDSKMEVIPATVPILRLTDAVSKLQVDINVESTVGIRNTHLLHSYAQCDWRVRPLVVCVKVWAASKNINCARDGTVSSYSLALMVIHYLQCGVSPPVLPCLQQCLRSQFVRHTTTDSIHLTQPMPRFTSANTDSLGKLLIGFMHYYNNFRYGQCAMSVRYGKLTSVKNCILKDTDKASYWTYLCIQEPFNFTNTARSVFNYYVFNGILRVFDRSYQLLSKNKNLNDIIKGLNSSSSAAVPRSLTSSSSSSSLASTNTVRAASISSASSSSQASTNTVRAASSGNAKGTKSPSKQRSSSAADSAQSARTGDEEGNEALVETNGSKIGIEADDNSNREASKPATVQNPTADDPTQLQEEEKVTKTDVMDARDRVKSPHSVDVHNTCNGNDDIEELGKNSVDGVAAAELLSAQASCASASEKEATNITFVIRNLAVNRSEEDKSSNSINGDKSKRVPLHHRPIVDIEADDVVDEINTNVQSAKKTQKIVALGKSTLQETADDVDKIDCVTSSMTNCITRPSQQRHQENEVSTAMLKSMHESREGNTVGRKDESYKRLAGDSNSSVRASCGVQGVTRVLKPIQHTSCNNLQLQQARSGVRNKLPLVLDPVVSHMATASMDKVPHLGDSVNTLCLKC